jgi:phosphoglycerate kinase
VPVPTLETLLAAPGGVRGRRVFVRADLNVPLRAGAVGDDSRIRASLPNLRHLMAAGARVVLGSHLGRPKGKPVDALSLRPVAARLAELLGCGVSFAADCVGPTAEQAARELRDGEILLLENLRFHPGEERNEPAFARSLANLADAYVNDAFGTSHRAHASTVGIVAHLQDAVAGDLLGRELDHLDVIREPVRPLLCFLGGAKVSDKLAVLEVLALHADVLALGGAMAYTFMRALGEPTGTSLVEVERVEDARRVLRAAEDAGKRVLLPSDHLVVQRLAEDAASQVCEKIPEGWMGVDIGPETARSYAAEALRARTLFWNGPMGVFELPPFAKGTEAVALAVAESEAISVVGGGDSLAAIQRVGVADRIGHLSTGGGASLEYVQGLTLPGVAALEARA